MTGSNATLNPLTQLRIPQKFHVSPLKSEKNLHFFRRLLSIELLWFEFAAPFHKVIMLLVFRISQCFQKLIEAADASHIFGRTGSLTFNAQRIFLTRFFLRAALKENFVVPAVAEIVLVSETESLAGFLAGSC